MEIVTKMKRKWMYVPITIKASFAYTASSILQRCISFITLPLFTRLLTTEEYGKSTIFESWLSLMSIVLTLNLAYGSFSTAMVKFEDRRDEYISSMGGLCLLLSSFFLMIYMPFHTAFNQLFELPTYLVILMVIEILCSTAFSMWSGKKRFEFKYKSVVVISLLSALLSPALAFIFVINSESRGEARILGYAVVQIIVGGIICFINLSRGKKIFSKDLWAYALKFNIPLLAYYLSQVVFNQSDRIMISHITGTGDAAMYGVAYNLAMILTFVLNAINNSYVPWLYEKIKSGKQTENRNVSVGIAVLMSVLILCVVWFAPEIIGIMAGKKYLEAVGVVAPVSMSLLLLFYSQLFINIEFYYEEKKSLVAASIGAALVNIVLNGILIPIFGFVAAGYTTLISYFIFAGCNYIQVKKLMSKNGDGMELYNMPALLAVLAIFCICCIVGMCLYSHTIIRIVIAAFVLIITLSQYKKILHFINAFRRN